MKNVIKVAELEAINHIDLWIAPVTDSNPSQQVTKNPASNSNQINSNPTVGNVTIPTVGSITSEADVTHKAAIARTMFGVNREIFDRLYRY